MDPGKPYRRTMDRGDDHTKFCEVSNAGAVKLLSVTKHNSILGHRIGG